MTIANTLRPLTKATGVTATDLATAIPRAGAATAASCAASTSARTQSSPTAHNTDTDFGDDAVTSNPRTDVSEYPLPSSRSGSRGSSPAINARNCSSSTVPDRPSIPAAWPCQIPRGSSASR